MTPTETWVWIVTSIWTGVFIAIALHLRSIAQSLQILAGR